MSIISRLKQWTFGDAADYNLQLKAALTVDAGRVGVNGRPLYPTTDTANLNLLARRNEITYACIEKICQAGNDPVLLVEKKTGDEWESIEHPLIALLSKPNLYSTGGDFRRALLASDHIAGTFYAEIIRNRRGEPAELHALEPNRVQPWLAADGRSIASYRYANSVGQVTNIPAENIIFRKRFDLLSRFGGLSPLAVALGSVDGDNAQTDYVRAFFNNDATPSGLLKYKSQLTQEQGAAINEAWARKYGRGAMNQKGIAVIDEDVEFQKIGSNLDEIESESTRSQSESRICMVFGVPPILIGALVGLIHQNNRASAQAAQQDFWQNKMSPEMTSLREWLTWNLLPLFSQADALAVKNGTLRVNWDMSQVLALQEDVDARHTRARENLRAGLWTINEARTYTGKEALPEDYFLQPTQVRPISEENQQTIALRPLPKELPAVPAELTEGDEDLDAEIIVDKPKARVGDDKINLNKYRALAHSDFKSFGQVSSALMRQMRKSLTDLNIADIVKDAENETLNKLALNNTNGE